MADSMAVYPEACIPKTTREWYEWLVSEEEKTVAVYREKPSLLIADHRREQETARDYRGREILELLQNANDQAAELGKPGRVLIELSAEGLIVANTGLAFSVGGVASLQTSHLSPKRRRQKQLIGSKGLGFRSILNWSRTPIILSGALCLAYCTEHARNKLRTLTDEDPELARLVKDEQQGNDALILPLLPFPLYSENGDLAARLVDDSARRIFERCETLLIEGYDTVIGMPFDTATGYKAAGMQLDEIRPEILLFTQHLEELHFRKGGEAEQIWRLDQSDGLTRVLCNGQPLGAWYVYRAGDTLPAEAREPGQGDDSGFEVVVAVPANGSRVSSPMFSYFPTDVNVPLPVVCHATLELEQNRKHLQQERKSNEFVLNYLADFLARIAEQTAADPANEPWAGCSLLMPLGDFPADLKRVSFPERLMKAAQPRVIVPTLKGSPAKADNARLIAGASASWLPASPFSEVALIRREEELRFLRLLGVPPLEPDTLKKTILDHPELSLDERVALVDGLLHHQISKEAFTSALFLDASGKSLEDAIRVFVTPSGGQVPDLPEWLDLRFLSEIMRSKLATRLGTRDNRELQQRLAGFGLLEYSLASVVSALVAAANRAIKAAPERTELFETDLLRTVFRLYQAEGQASKRPEYPERSPLRLRNQRNKSASADSLYLGRGFGTQGEIVQSLYGPWAPEKLIAGPEVLGLTGDLDILRQFLLWLGVAQWPREETLSQSNSGYVEHILRTISYPAQFGDKVVRDPDAATSAHASGVSTVDGLDQILHNADPAAVAAWLSTDSRIPDWQRPAAQHAKLGAYPGGVYNARLYQGPLPSYLRWVIETTAWLRSSEGESLRPKDCVLGERAAEGVFPHPAMPTDAELTRYGVLQSDVIEGWRRAGVLTSLAYLERDEIYAKLLELPQRSPDGRLARPLYLWLLDASDTAIGDSGVNYKEFCARGKMWGRFGDTEGYFPISQLHHADVEGLPEVLLNRLKIVDLRKRVGAEKVERLFGAKPIDRAGIEQKVIVHQSAVGSTEANMGFQAAKPYLHKLRTSQTSQVSNLQTLKEMQLEVCSDLRAEITYKGETFEYDVPVWGWLIQDKLLYVRADPADPISLSADMLCDAIGEALASIFRIGDGGEFARMLLCKDKDRQQLLRRMRGESVIEDIESIKAEFATFQAKKPVEAPFPVTQPAEVQPTSTIEPAAPPDVPEEAPEPNGEIKESPLQITEKPHVVSPPPKEQKLRVKRVTTPTPVMTTAHRVVDSDFCERKAMEFEEADEPPRFPLLVSQITGSEGPKCDILSFPTAEKRDAFQVGPTRDLDSVIRFIEVKGRSNEIATIELKGNELSAAEKYDECYYLYRLFEEDGGGFVLAILQNPLKHKEALQPAVHVSLGRAAAMQQFSLVGGIQKQ